MRSLFIENEYAGLFKLLATVPMWAVALFILLVGTSIGLSYLIGDKTSGVYFNTSYSSTMGDLCLCVVVLIGVTVLQRGEPIPEWFSGLRSQVVWFAISMTVGILLVTVTTPLPHAEWPDRYHNFVVVPMYLFLLPMMLLAIMYNGSRAEVAAGCALMAIWAALVIYDFHDSRINQRQWLGERFGIRFEQGHIVKMLPPNKK